MIPEALQPNHRAILEVLGRHHLWGGHVRSWDDDQWLAEVVAPTLVLVGEKPPVYISASGTPA